MYRNYTSHGSHVDGDYTLADTGDLCVRIRGELPILLTLTLAHETVLGHQHTMSKHLSSLVLYILRQLHHWSVYAESMCNEAAAASHLQCLLHSISPEQTSMQLRVQPSKSRLLSTSIVHATSIDSVLFSMFKDSLTLNSCAAFGNRSTITYISQTPN